MAKPIELVMKAGDAQLLFDPYLKSYTQVRPAKSIKRLVKPGQRCRLRASSRTS
jgi:hypothetical protein